MLWNVFENSKKINAGEGGEKKPVISIYINEISNNSLDVYKDIQNLKNNKAPDSTDKILSEYLKHSRPLLAKVYCKLFTIVLDTGMASFLKTGLVSYNHFF